MLRLLLTRAPKNSTNSAIPTISNSNTVDLRDYAFGPNWSRDYRFRFNGQ
jgi:hypothetical protein